MLIKVNKGNRADILLYNKPRSKNDLQTDHPVSDWKEQVEKLAEIRRRYENDTTRPKDWDPIIQQFLRSELNSKINWEQPSAGARSEGLEYLSKKLIAELTFNIVEKFDYSVVRNGHPLPLPRFMAYLTDTFGLKFVTAKPFAKYKAHLNGYYDKKKKTIHINPELEGTGLFAFVIAHEIGHFFLHENLVISQDHYDRTADSKYGPLTRKYLFKKEKHWIEWQANYFASCLLMPHRCLLWQLIKWQLGQGISRRGYL